MPMFNRTLKVFFGLAVVGFCFGQVNSDGIRIVLTSDKTTFRGTSQNSFSPTDVEDIARSLADELAADFPYFDFVVTMKAAPSIKCVIKAWENGDDKSESHTYPDSLKQPQKPFIEFTCSGEGKPVQLFHPFNTPKVADKEEWKTALQVALSGLIDSDLTKKIFNFLRLIPVSHDVSPAPGGAYTIVFHRRLSGSVPFVDCFDLVPPGQSPAYPAKVPNFYGGSERLTVRGEAKCKNEGAVPPPPPKIDRAILLPRPSGREPSPSTPTAKR